MVIGGTVRSIIVGGIIVDGGHHHPEADHVLRRSRLRQVRDISGHCKLHRHCRTHQVRGRRISDFIDYVCVHMFRETLDGCRVCRSGSSICVLSFVCCCFLVSGVSHQHLKCHHHRHHSPSALMIRVQLSPRLLCHSSASKSVVITVSAHP